MDPAIHGQARLITDVKIEKLAVGNHSLTPYKHTCTVPRFGMYLREASSVGYFNLRKLWAPMVIFNYVSLMC